MTAPLKKCSQCGELKPATLENFYRRKRAKDGWESCCRVCSKKAAQAWQTANPEKFRASQKKHRERERAKRANHPRPQKVEKLPKTETVLEQHIQTFLEARKNLTPSTLKGYRVVLSSYARAYPDFPPTAQSVLDWLSSKNYTAGTRFINFVRIQTFTNWLCETERVSTNPLAGIVKPRQPDNLPRAPKEQDVKKVLVFLESEVERTLQASPFQSYRFVRDLAGFSLMLDAGMRVGEVCNLDILDIDLAERTAFISHTKTKKQRYAVFGKQVKGNLKLWLDIRAQLDIPDDLKAVFVCERGCWKRFGPTGFEQILRTYCEKAGAKPFTPHQLRHFCATQGLKNGQNIERLRQQLGHSDIKTTSKYFMMPNEGRTQDHLRTSPLDNLGGVP